MTKPIKIDFVTDTSKVVRGADNIAEAFEDVQDSLRDVDRAGDRAADALVDGARDATRAQGRLDDAMDDTVTAARTMERRVEAAFEGIEQSARTSSSRVAEVSTEGFREAGEGTQQLAEEADANAREVAASFDGSAESILDGFQGLAAEALAGFGPAGMAAGLALAAGIGLAVNKMNELAEANNEAQQTAADLAGEFSDAGGDISKMDLAGIIKEWGRQVQDDNWLTFWKDEATTNFQEVAEWAKDAGVAVRDSVKGMKGTAEDSQGFLDGTQEEWERLTKAIQDGSTETARGGRVMNEAAKEADAKREALGKLRDGAQENLDTTNEAIEIYNIEKDALGDVAQTAEEAAEAVQALADANNESAESAMGADEAAMNWVTTLDQMTKDIATNGATMDINTAAGRANRESLIELAQSGWGQVEALVAAGGATADVTAKAEMARNAFITQAEAAGLSRTEAEALATSYGLIPGNVSTLVQAQGTEEAKAAVASIPEAKDTTVTVAEEGTAGVQKTIDQVKDGDAEVQVKETGAAAVQKSIDNIRGRDVVVNLVIGNAGVFSAELDRLTAARTQYVDIVARKGEGVDH